MSIDLTLATPSADGARAVSSRGVQTGEPARPARAPARRETFSDLVGRLAGREEAEQARGDGRSEPAAVGTRPDEARGREAAAKDRDDTTGGAEATPPLPSAPATIQAEPPSPRPASSPANLGDSDQAADEQTMQVANPATSEGPMQGANAETRSALGAASLLLQSSAGVAGTGLPMAGNTTPPSGENAPPARNVEDPGEPAAGNALRDAEACPASGTSEARDVPRTPGTRREQGGATADVGDPADAQVLASAALSAGLPVTPLAAGEHTDRFGKDAVSVGAAPVSQEPGERPGMRKGAAAAPSAAPPTVTEAPLTVPAEPVSLPGEVAGDAPTRVDRPAQGERVEPQRPSPAAVRLAAQLHALLGQGVAPLAGHGKPVLTGPVVLAADEWPVAQDSFAVATAQAPTPAAAPRTVRPAQFVWPTDARSAGGAVPADAVVAAFTAQQSSTQSTQGERRHGEVSSPTPPSAVDRVLAVDVWPAGSPPVTGNSTSPAGSSVAGSAGGGPAVVDEHGVVPQVVKAIHLQWRQGIGEARLRLDPAHLGEVHVSLRVTDGAVSAFVRAENSTVQAWIDTRQQELRSALEEQGLRLERFEVVVDPDGRRDRNEQQPPTPRARASRARADAPRFEVSV